MMAYDFDGVLVPDILRSGCLDREECRQLCKPMFIPEQPYYIISGRNWTNGFANMDRWIRSHFAGKDQPYGTCCASIDDDPNQFKLAVLEKYEDIDTYVESDLETIAFLAKNLKRKIRLLHFGTLIQKALAAPPRKTLELTYDALERMCLEIANKVRELPLQPTAVVAVLRGGMFPAQMIARALKLPIGIWTPPRGHLILPDEPEKRLLFVDDEIGLGRTYQALRNMIASYFPNLQWNYVAVICDSEFKNAGEVFYGIKTEDWVVMPWRRNQPQKVMEIASGTRVYNRDRSK